MVQYKIYKEGNYIRVINNTTQEKFSGFCKDVFVDKDNILTGIYIIYNILNFKDRSLQINNILKQDGTPYLESEWETFYSENTGNFNSPQAGGTQTALTVPYDNTDSTLIATNVQEALDELDVKIITSTSGIGGGINEWSGVKTTAIGTSITAYGQYVTALNSLLGVTIQNLGYAGGSLSSSSIYSPQKIYDQISLIATDAELILLEIGINDFRGNATLGTINDTTLATFYGAVYKTVVDILTTNNNRKVIILTPYGNIDTYASGRWDNPNDNGNTLFQFCNAIRETAIRLGVWCFNMGSESGINGLTNELYCSDGIHLNTLGGVLYAKTINRLLRNIPHDIISTGGGTTGWNLHNVTIEELSASLATVDSLNELNEISVTKTSTYGVLWLASGDNNAAEWEVTGGANAWLCYGEGVNGWVGTGDYSTFAYYFAFSGLFDAVTSAITFKSPATALSAYASASKYRASRVGDILLYEAFIGGNWVTVVNQGINAINTDAGYQENIKIGLLIGDGIYSIKNVRVGTFS